MPQLAFETYTPQLVWLAITFVLLYLVMWRVLLPRIGEVLDERQNRIQHDLDEAGFRDFAAMVAANWLEQKPRLPEKWQRHKAEIECAARVGKGGAKATQLTKTITNYIT